MLVTGLILTSEEIEVTVHSLPKVLNSMAEYNCFSANLNGEVINDLGKNNKYGIILDRSQDKILHAGQAVDLTLTDQVIKYFQTN